ncbi:uncharacterized protein [Physcomitrium patens]|uniref:Uncharacterized protein n=1 Tax=Physcomitrium patens TaxID=3218 RepID=A0A2K1JGV9_PHYPA|nr:uncharacterized protein LOC112291888 [Physcomitrium patens]PNR40791.1 hypothetical protein PHYPA_018194 [Physcomitrium patens]|eukprot:XP_024395614.1 uncharacterized protein LOC112291888 [Physcomitrella patens]
MEMRIGVAVLAVVALHGLFHVALVSAEEQAFAQTQVYGGSKEWTLWSAVVVGKVFCDQCIQNKVFPYAHPMSKAKVKVECKDASGNVVDYADASTNFLGDFIVSFKGKEDLTGCSVSLAGSPDSKCSIVGGGGKTVTLKSKFLFKALYVVDPLFYKPALPMEFCSKPKKGPSPPPSPSGGGITIPFPNRRPSTCSCLDWLRPDYKCYWPKDMQPWKTTVGTVFGKGAQQKYGSKTLAGGLLTEDELLRQAISAILNSRTNMHFYMSPRAIQRSFAKALYASEPTKAAQAKAFKDANNGYGKGKCLLVSCKW